MVFDQNEPRPPARQVETAENVHLVTLDINRDEVDRRRRAGLDENVIERPRRNLDRSVRNDPGHDEVAFERRMRPGKE